MSPKLSLLLLRDTVKRRGLMGSLSPHFFPLLHWLTGTAWHSLGRTGRASCLGTLQGLCQVLKISHVPFLGRSQPPSWSHRNLWSRPCWYLQPGPWADPGPDQLWACVRLCRGHRWGKTEAAGHLLFVNSAFSAPPTCHKELRPLGE